MPVTEKTPPALPTSPKFGTFLGVFTPSLLTILGVIMYLRFGWVVASVGLGGTLVIVVVCSAIALITAWSAAAVATNMAWGPGGEYYMISRNLGLAIGGAIGIPLFLCRILSVTLYCFGLAEALAMLWPASWMEPPIQIMTVVLILLTTAVAGKSAAFSLKLQVPLMALVGLSIAALAIGVLTGPIRLPEWVASPERAAESGGFWLVLAVFFPAVTGFATGIGLSGDLKDPQKSIPRGILLAVIVGTIIYLGIPFLLAITDRVTPGQLADIRPNAPSVWALIALLGGWTIFPGMWSAILSSAFGSVLAGSRVLQSLARDGLAPAFLARSSKSGQPTVATAVGGAAAILAVALGDLNTVALVVTVFFLTLYMSINLIAASERLVGDPSYRPTIHLHWVISMLGAVLCLWVMYLISPWGCAAAISLELLVWLILRRQVLRTSWGDSRAGIWGSLARFALRKLSHAPLHPRNWRPNILLFADQINARPALARMASWFNQNRGVLTVCDMMTGQCPADMAELGTREAALNSFFRREGILAFAEVDMVEEFESGAILVAQANGMGGLRSNTVIFGWPNRPVRLESLLRIIRTLDHLGKAALIIRDKPGPGTRRFNRIDIWWRGREHCGDLMLLLAYLLSCNPEWRRARITLRSIAEEEGQRGPLEKGLKDLIATCRIQAECDVRLRPADATVPEVIRQVSRDADVVFLGLRIPEPGQEPQHVQHVAELVEGLPTTILVHNSGPLAGHLI
jgi:amino acid transporter